MDERHGTESPEDEDAHSTVSETDAQFVKLLTRYDELKAQGDDVRHIVSQITDLGCLAEFESTRRCIRLIDQLWSEPSLNSQEASSPESNFTIPDSVERLGKFKIEEELGRGGGGIVYLAVDTTLDRHVALKVPHPAFLLAADLRKRFLAEARHAAALDHQNIVPVYETGEIGPVCFIAAKYYPGPNLSQWMLSTNEVVPQVEVANFILTLVEAVQYAHDKGILHRDLKPSNVMLELNSECKSSSGVGLHQLTSKLTDFGLAKTLAGSSHPTRSGAVLGTPEYMAPEQADGRHDEVGPSTDVYAVGLILYELLSGVAPFRSTSEAKTLVRIALEDAPLLRKYRKDIDRDLEAICLKCLEKDPSRRYASMSALGADLRCFIDGSPTSVRPVHIGKRIAKWIRRRPEYSALGTAIALLLCFSFSMVFSSRSVDHTSTTSGVNRATELAQQALSDEIAKRHEYIDAVSNAYSAWSNGEIESADQLLNSCIPVDHQLDQRGFEWYFVRRLCVGGLRTMGGHNGKPIRASSYSADGELLATCGDDGNIQIWLAEAGSLSQLIRTSSSRIVSLAFAQQGKTLVAGSDDGAIRFWDTSSWNEVDSIETGFQTLTCLAVSPDDKAIAAAGDRGEIRVFDFAGTFQRTINSECDRVEQMDISSTGHVAAACHSSARIWNLNSGELIRSIEHRKEIHAVDYSTDGSRLLTGGAFIHIWDAEYEQVGRYFGGHENRVVAVKFSPSGKLIASAGFDEDVRVWNVDSRECVNVLRGHYRPIFSLAFSPDESQLASSDKGGHIKTWQTTGSQQFRTLPMAREGRELLQMFMPKSEILAVASEKRDLSLWNVVCDEPAVLTKTLRSELTDRMAPSSIDCSSNGEYFVVGTAMDWTVFDMQGVDSVEATSVTSPINSIRFVPQRPWVAFTTPDPECELRFANVLTNEIVSTDSGRFGLSFSPDGNWYTVFDFPGSVNVRDVETHEEITIIDDLRTHLASSDIATDEPLLALGLADGAVRLYDTRTFRQLQKMHGHENGVTKVAFTPDEQCVISGGVDGTIRFWDVLTGRSIITLTNPGQVRAISFSSDGQVLAAAIQDNRPNSQIQLFHAPRMISGPVVRRQ